MKKLIHKLDTHFKVSLAWKNFKSIENIHDYGKVREAWRSSARLQKF